MQYLCLVHLDRSLEAGMTAEEEAAYHRDNRAYGEWLEAEGFTVFSALEAPETATLIRTRGSKVSMTDGPYVETKEHLGGFILIEAATQEEAVEIVRRCPVSRIGTLEVRAAHRTSPLARTG